MLEWFVSEKFGSTKDLESTRGKLQFMESQVFGRTLKAAPELLRRNRGSGKKFTDRDIPSDYLGRSRGKTLRYSYHSYLNCLSQLGHASLAYHDCLPSFDAINFLSTSMAGMLMRVYLRGKALLYSYHAYLNCWSQLFPVSLAYHDCLPSFDVVKFLLSTRLAGLLKQVYFEDQPRAVRFLQSRLMLRWSNVRHRSLSLWLMGPGFLGRVGWTFPAPFV